MMSPGERVMACLLGQKVDRIPFGVGLGWSPWSQTLAKWREETGRLDLDIRAEFDMDLSFVCPKISLGMNPAFERLIFAEDDQHIIWRNNRGVILRDRKDGMSMPEFLEYPVKTRADWEIIKTQRWQFGLRDRVIPAEMEDLKNRVSRTGEAVQVGTYPWGVFGTARELMGAEELLMSFYEQPDLVRDIMNHLTSVWIQAYQWVAQHIQIDHIHIWEDMSGKQGSLISPAMIEQFMMPCYDRIAAFAREAGVRVISVDTDGYCDQLIPIMMNHGINMMFPFEVQAGNDLLALRRRYPTLGMMHGLDKRALAHSHAAVDQQVEIAQQAIRLGRYIPGFDHLIPPDARWDNFAYAARQLKDVCYRLGE